MWIKAEELLKGLVYCRPSVAQVLAERPETLISKLQSAVVRAFPLRDFPTLSNVFADDVDPELTFAQHVHTLGRP